jgi:hypothetical protein
MFLPQKPMLDSKDMLLPKNKFSMEKYELIENNKTNKNKLKNESNFLGKIK